MTPENAERLELHIRTCGPVAISYDLAREEFVIGSEWGEEAPDSPMVGAAAYGAGATLDEALAEFFHDTGATVEVSRTCPKPWIVNCRRAIRNDSETYCRRVCFDQLDIDIKERIASGV